MQSIVILSGSMRSDNQSARIAAWVAERLTSGDRTDARGTTAERRTVPAAQAAVIDMADHPLPLWGDSDESAVQRRDETWPELRDQLRAATGMVVVAPEYGGMVPPALKNLFLHAGGAELADKPCLIIGVSSGRSGSYPVAELRMSSFKNNYLCYIPDQVILRGVEDILHGADDVTAADWWARERLYHGMDVLLAYADALGAVRRSGARDLKLFPNGM